jgi:hypothetical protein
MEKTTVFTKIFVLASILIVSGLPANAEMLELTKKPWAGNLSDLCQPVENLDDYDALNDFSKKKRAEILAKKNAESDSTCLILQVSGDEGITYITHEGNGDWRYSTKLEISFYKYVNPSKPSKVTKKAKKTIVTGTIK